MKNQNFEAATMKACTVLFFLSTFWGEYLIYCCLDGCELCHGCAQSGLHVKALLTRENVVERLTKVV